MKCSKTRIPLIVVCAVTSFITLSLTAVHAEVTLTVGRGSGMPGATESPVAVSLDTDEKVSAIQLDICGDGNFLTCSGCEITDRTEGFTCSVSEQGNGCCRMALVSLSDDIIEDGTGPVATVLHSVTSGATGCVVLNPQNVAVADEQQNQINADVEPGGFCFPCTSDEDCDDGLYCTGEESCADDACAAGTNPCGGGTVCDDDSDSCVASTTTTAGPSSTTTTGPSSTTTTADSSTTTTGPSSTTTTTSGDASIEVITDNVWKSRWVALPKLLVIEGSGTSFQPFKTKVDYDPRDAIFKLFPIVLGDNYIWNIVLIMPGWFAGAGDQEVTVTVTSDGEIVSDDFLIQELPLLLEQK